MPDLNRVYHQRASSILYNILLETNLNSYFLLPANICPIVVTTFLKAKKNFEFVDINVTDLCMDQEVVYEKIAQNATKYDGILFVRTYGTEQSFECFFTHLKNIKGNLFIIDDFCLSIPSFQPKETVADVILYSTGYSKYAELGFGAYAFITKAIPYKNNLLDFSEEDHKRLLDKFKLHIENRVPFTYQDSDWLNTQEPIWEWDTYKSHIIKKTEEATVQKEKLNKLYYTHLPSDIQLKADFQNWRFNILVPEKEILLSTIFKNNLFASSHYASAGNLFAHMNFPNTETLHNKVINLFNDHRFNQQKAMQLIEIINHHLNCHS